MSTVAVFLALAGGAAFAASLGKNSVGSKQLKKNAVVTAKIKKEAVTGGKVKKDTLTGTQINEGTLGAVPLANSIPPAEATHLIGAAGEPAFEGGSSNFGSESGISTQPAGFYKDHEGIVHLQGLVKVGTGGTIGKVFTLPAGFRPATGTLQFFTTFCAGVECSGKEESALIIGGSNVSLSGFDLSGAVVTTKETTVSLGGITFRAES
jgi:hypothetical protein